MIILTLRTDKPEAEVGLFDVDVKGLTSHKHTSPEVNVRGQTFHIEKLAYEIWPAHRELAETIHLKINQLLLFKGRTLKEVGGIVCFKGPGSFTGLRIGLTVANALAYAQNIPVVARPGTNWLKTGIKDLLAGQNDKIAIPEYGSPPHITSPKK